MTKRLTGEFARYVAVGVSGAAGFFLIQIGLTEGLGVWYPVSGLCGYIFVAVWGFTLNKKWTFRK